MYILSILMLIFAVVSAELSSDKLSLLDFKAKVEEDGPMGLLRGWNESTDACSWPGVTCDRDRVTKLNLTDWGLKGQLSPSVGNLSFLQELRLHNNSFGGEIPPEIGRLFRLRLVSFWRNSFVGEIPANISGCSSLRVIEMNFNNLTGRIPAEVGSLPELSYLNLAFNNLVGEMPPSLGNLSRLNTLFLGSNALSGTIPATIGSLGNLRQFDISYNYIKGNIPLSLYNSSRLEDLSVGRNKLEGTLPLDLGYTLPNLQQFFLFENNFSGFIPATLSNASKLIHFVISSNKFFGKVPSFSGSPNLQELGLDTNHLGYTKIGDLNFLCDTINNSSLEFLSIGVNSFGGAIPSCTVNSTSIRALAIGENQITGNIPSWIGDLVNLEVLALEINHLIGQIPSTIGKLGKVNIISLAMNNISGHIPVSMGNLTLLSRLNLEENSLQGSIPTSLGGCTSLQYLNLQRNKLTGLVPSELVSLSSLSVLLDLSFNHLSGSIPSEIGKLVHLTALDVSENKLSGEIPRSIGSCSSMVDMSFSKNFLSGSIPEDIRHLKGIQEINLSSNSLSGRIPAYFADFQGLEYLDMSFNQLEGPVPVRGVFKNTSEFSVDGNSRLCGGLPEMKLPTCVANTLHKHHKPSPSTVLIVIIVVCCILVGLIATSTVIICVFLKRKRTKPASEESIGTSLCRISYGDLLQATDRFSSSNLIGAGGFGSVYKGTLSREDNKLVAVKVLNLHVSRASKSFVAECESLGSVRHRNLVKLLTVCSSNDFQGNDFKALIYEFMENGNLEEWLHSGKRLSLIQRIKIAIDVATAIDYLHNHCFEPIIHCDIKPSNILLDNDMIARVSDFGLAKLLRNDTSNENSFVSVIRGTIGYIPPEYATGSEVSKCGDIYSFGVLLLEMFSAKRPTDIMFKDEFDLNEFASTGIPDRIDAILDPVIFEEQRDPEEIVFKSSVISIFEIGVACSSKRIEDRRNIRDVVSELQKILDSFASTSMRNRVYNTC